jgi:catechol 2,3-dioxygenase-like lactoylglutathione lyase family enzyme
VGISIPGRGKHATNRHRHDRDRFRCFSLRRIDHVRFFVGNARQSAYFYRNAFGFDVVAYAGLETKSKQEAGYVLRQGDITFVVVSPLSAHHSDNRRLLLEKDDGRALIQSDPRPEHFNSWKGVHGGVLLSVLDVALSSAARSLDPACIGATTVEMKTNFLAAATGRFLTEGRSQRAGRVRVPSCQWWL